MKDNKAVFHYFITLQKFFLKLVDIFHFITSIQLLETKKNFFSYESSKENKVLKSKIKLSLFLNNMIVYVKHKLLVLTSELDNCYKSNIKYI